MIAVEDAGDGLHAARNALDSAFVFHVRARTAGRPRRSGSSARAVIRRRRSTPANGGFGKNEGDNEITGIHISDGDPSVRGLIGTHNPAFDRESRDSSNEWRFFSTQQHGDNLTYEIFANPN